MKRGEERCNNLDSVGGHKGGAVQEGKPGDVAGVGILVVLSQRGRHRVQQLRPDAPGPQLCRKCHPAHPRSAFNHILREITENTVSCF